MIAVATPAAISIPSGTYVYSFMQGASSLGTVTIAVSNDGTAARTHEVASIAATKVTVDQTVDASSGVPSLVDVTAGTASATMHIDVTAQSARETIPGTVAPKTLSPPAGTNGFVVLGGPILSGLMFTPEQARALGSKSLEAVDPGSATTFALAISPADASTRPKSVRRDDVGIRVSGLPSGDIVIWYDPATLVPSDFEIPAQGLSIVLTKQSATPHMQATPAPQATSLPTPIPHFSSTDVTFASADGTKLAGTVTVPDALRGRAAAVVLVHGSGPTDRDETIGPNPIFLELSNALSNHGYIVLRYDKRGIGRSGGIANAATRDDLLADARSAISFLDARSDVDPKRVFVIGHSEGGELAPSLAAGGAPLRGIALMAPPALPLEQILVQQATRGTSGAEKQQAQEREEHELADIRAGRSNPGDIWLRSSFGIDPAAVIQRVPCPILILQGGKDIQVLLHDLPRLVNAAKAAHRDVTVRVFPNDDHLFITVSGSAPSTGAEYFVPHRLDPAMIASLLAWLDGISAR